MCISRWEGSKNVSRHIEQELVELEGFLVFSMEIFRSETAKMTPESHGKKAACCEMQEEKKRDRVLEHGTGKLQIFLSDNIHKNAIFPGS